MILKKRFFKGFSTLEVLVVLAITLILATIAIAGFGGFRKNIKTVKTANTLTALFQQARQRAITNRIPHSVTIARDFDSSGKRNIITISSIDTTKTPIKTDVIRQEYLLQDISFMRPTNVALAIASNLPPEDVFRQTAFIGQNTITIFFNIDGSVTSGNYFPVSGSNPFTASFFISDAPGGVSTTTNPNLTRVVSLYASTGGVKTWSYNNGTYQTGNKNF
ncbi:MAG: hypothetical protein HY819_20265 [Acidobacteria bacterium]|nr:hypothetical protein [Acidobacteriota bacterium]